jgi:putative DNA primase/helicase
VRIVERTGWQGAAFVFPDETIGDTNGEPVLLQTVSSNRHAYRQSGTLEDWQREISRLCVGNSRLTFSVSSAFASMLLRIIGEENGGFHFRGHSSLGKTTLLSVASSVFGCGDLRGGYVQTWRNTGNGLEAIAALYNDTLLCLDEIKQVDPREVGEIAYRVANGSGKGRADRAGLAREKQTWCLLFLSSGELSLGDHLTTIGKSPYGGEEVDIPADTDAHGAFEALHGYPDGAAFSQALNQAPGPITAWLRASSSGGWCRRKLPSRSHKTCVRISTCSATSSWPTVFPKARAGRCGGSRRALH